MFCYVSVVITDDPQASLFCETETPKNVLESNKVTCLLKAMTKGSTYSLAQLMCLRT